MDKIFIQIASYRDPQCGPTIQDLINKAQNPERLSFGVCLQWMFEDTEEALSCGPESLPNWPTLRLKTVHAKDSKGTCWARAKCQSLWHGEAFTLQIDSHMRAEPDWDALITSHWQQLNNQKGILSCYPNGFTITPEQTIAYSRERLPLMAAKAFGDDGLLRLQGISKYPIPDGLPRTPPNGAFISAGMLFAPSSILEDTPYDPHLYFYGEESSYAARLWTAGYDLYNPHRPLLYHLYKTAVDRGATHWQDHANWSDLNKRAITRAQNLLNCRDDLGPYGLGSERSMADYQAWSGINFAAQTIQQHALDGLFG